MSHWSADVLPDGDPEKPAVTYMANHFKPGSRIAAWAVKVVVAARLEPVTMGPEQRAFETVNDLATWLEENDVVGVYLDPELRRYEPRISTLIEELPGLGFMLGYGGQDSDIQILLRSSAD